jgi:hypothetical protein
MVEGPKRPSSASVYPAGGNTGGNEVGTHRVRGWPLVSAHVTSKMASLQAIARGHRRSGRLGRPSTEPKVRRSNPLGRATPLRRSYTFAGGSLLAQRRGFATRKPVSVPRRVSGEPRRASRHSDAAIFRWPDEDEQNDPHRHALDARRDARSCSTRPSCAGSGRGTRRARGGAGSVLAGNLAETVAVLLD